MPARLRPLEPADLPRVVDLSLRAWEPVFTSLRTVLGDEVFQRLYRTGGATRNGRSPPPARRCV